MVMPESVEIIKAVTPIIGALCVAWVAVCALNHNIDGLLVTTVVGALCLLAGVESKALRELIESKRG